MINLDFPTFPVLETERLILRKPSFEDRHEIFILRSDEGVNKYLDRPRAETLEDAVKHIERLMGLLVNKEWLGWAITLKESPKLIGSVGVWQFSYEERSADLGYELLPEYQGKGIMREAVKRVLEFGADEMHLLKATATIVEENTASAKLLKDFGFQLNLDFKDGHGAEVQYVLNLKKT